MDKLTARKLLGVEVNADIREIKKAYARKVKEVHPEEDPEGFKQINEAYEFLKQTSTQIHHNTFEEEVFTKKESIESTNHFDYIHEEKTENEFIEANTDFDALLDKENKRQENYEKAILELREYFTNPTTKLVDYKILYNNPDYQSFIYHDEFIEELVGLLKNIQLSPEMNQFFYQTYHLNKSNTSSKRKLKKIVSPKPMMYFLTLLFVFLSFLFLFLQIRNIDLSKNMMVVGTIFIQIGIMFMLYKRNIKRKTYAASVMILIMTGFISYGIFGTLLSLYSESLMNTYVDVTIPTLLFWFFVLIGLCIYTGIKKTIQRLK